MGGFGRLHKTYKPQTRNAKPQTLNPNPETPATSAPKDARPSTARAFWRGREGFQGVEFEVWRSRDLGFRVEGCLGMLGGGGGGGGGGP